MHASSTSSSAHAAQSFQDLTPASIFTSRNCQGWDRVLARFLRSAGLLQALGGFESDVLVMNLDSEKEDLPPALEQLHHDLIKLSEGNESVSAIENRKPEYVHLATEAGSLSHTQLTRSISALLAQNRARNNVSNRNEFLRKRRRIDSSVETPAMEASTSTSEMLPTCARTDALPVNRDVQMKYDIAKNEGGPLKRTIKSEKIEVDPQPKSEERKGKEKASIYEGDSLPTLQRHPGLGERFVNLESHLAVRYVPSPPKDLLTRVQFLENHVMRLERDYPPWAALHFNQPNRRWPPPPRATPLIVPSHLTSSDQSQEDSREHSELGPFTATSVWSAEPSRPGNTQGVTAKPKARAKSSSLHRAVMHKLEVKKALAGED